MPDIPGASGGFLRASIRATTAKAFTLDPVGAPEAGAPISLSWKAAGRTGSKMTISLRYATPGSATLDQQFRCRPIDDGARAVPAALASGAGNRNALASRSRTSEMELPGAALQLPSTFTVPTPQPVP